MKRTIVAFCGAVLLAGLGAGGVASAAPLEAGQVPADVKWVAHLDVESLLDTGLASFLLDQPQAQHFRDRMLKVAGKFGFNPLIDLKSVTIFGADHGPARAVALVRAKVEQEKLLELLRKSDGHEQLLEGERIVHRWTQKPEDKEDDGVRYGTLYAADLAVISRSKKALLESVAVLEGKAASLSADDKTLLPQSPKGTVFVAGARDIEVTDKMSPQWAMVKSMTMVVGEDEAVVFGAVVATVREEQQGEQVRQMLQGLQAMALLRLERGPSERNIPEMKHVLKGFTVSGEGALVRVDFAAALTDAKAVILKSPKLKRGR